MGWTRTTTRRTTTTRTTRRCPSRRASCRPSGGWLNVWKNGRRDMLDLDGQLLAAQRSELDTYDNSIPQDVRLQRVLAQVLQVEIHIELRTLVNRPDPTEAPGPVAAALVRAAQSHRWPRGLLRRRAPQLCRLPARRRAPAATASSPPTTPSRPARRRRGAGDGAGHRGGGPPAGMGGHERVAAPAARRAARRVVARRAAPPDETASPSVSLAAPAPAATPRHHAGGPYG